MKSIIPAIFIVLIVAGTFGFLYFRLEIPAKQEVSVEYSDLSISAELKNKKIITGYEIETINSTIYGNTSKSYQLETIPKNQIIKISNVNLEGQKFFREELNINLTENNHRIDLQLKESKDIEVKVFDGQPVKLNIYSDYAEGIQICLKSSINYIFLKAINMTETAKLDGYESWYKCYEVSDKIEKEDIDILIDYSEFSPAKSGDYIDAVLIQREMVGINDKIVNIK